MKRKWRNLLFINAGFILLTGLLLTMGACSTGNDDTVDDTYGNPQNLLILQAYGSNNTAAGASHSFVELYNPEEKPVKLEGISLYYADGSSTNSGLPGGILTEDREWKSIELSGTIPSQGSFLILGQKLSAGARYQIPDGYGDINYPEFNLTLSNRAFKVALLQSTETLDVQNPFNIDGTGKKAAGYIDMVGAANTYPDTDMIYGFETAPARCSASEAVRRKDLIDTNNNSVDFIAARYALGGLTNEELEVRKPRNSSAGTWDPFALPAEPPQTEGLMILQVFGIGTTEGDNTACTHSFIELYNNSGDALDLSSFSVHYADGPAGSWNKINLTGSIPANGSYLILGKQMRQAVELTELIGRLNLISITPDIHDDAFTLSNRSFKVALMSNQADIIVANPWEDSACIDLTSAINTSGTDSIDAAKGSTDLTAVNAASGGARTISKQKSWRRTSLSNTDVTLTDFTSKQYTTISSEDVEKFRPRTTADNSYTPEF